jgi:ADP-ribosylglycohydrolase
MLIEIAVADAYGAAFEFTDKPKINNDLSEYGRHPTGDLPNAAYTDDTMRAMANSIVLLYGSSYDWLRPESYITSICAIYESDKRAGWSKGFHTMLKNYESKPPMELMKALNRRSTNGCVMGVAPLGFIRETPMVKLAATMQTIATHSAAAVPYAQAVALSSHYLLHYGDTKSLVDFILNEVEWADDRQKEHFRTSLDDEPERPSMSAASIAIGAVWAANSFDNTSEILKWTCSRGGDTDSLAAVAIGIASCASDIKQDLPQHLLENVETEIGRKTLHELDEKLRQRFL